MSVLSGIFDPATGLVDTVLAEQIHLMTEASRLTLLGQAESALDLYCDILDRDPAHPAGALACFVQTLTDCTPEDLRQQRDRWYTAHVWPGEPAPHTNDRTADYPLRVGYVSGDFRRHSASFIFGGVVLHHTPAVIPYLYNTAPRSLLAGLAPDLVPPSYDERMEQFRQRAGTRWRDIAALTDEQAEALIRRDQIDILVDLSGHTMGGRLPLFTRRPAPVQVTAWGFAVGTGCPEIDYFLADPVTVPPEESHHYAEQVVYLPSLVTFDPDDLCDLPGQSEDPYWRNGYTTFGCFARAEKLSDTCLQTFAAILRACPDARLIFKDFHFSRPDVVERIRERMSDTSERITFQTGTPRRDHLLAYQQVDLCLDPFPHSGGAAALEQMAMGIPVVTLHGRNPAGRIASSILQTLGLRGQVAHSVEEYIDVAAHLGRLPGLLVEQRETLRTRLLASPIVTDYVEAVEEAYRKMWRQWASGGKR